MRCPRCLNVDLEEAMTKQGAVVDFCPTCNGVWLDSGEVFVFSQQPFSLERALEDRMKTSRPSRRVCPKCSVTMREVEFVKPDLWIDECLKCGGQWFDPGELRQVQRLDPALFAIEMEDEEPLEDTKPKFRLPDSHR